MATPQELARFESGPQNPRERVWWDRYSHERLNAWRQVQDPLADRCAAQIKFTRPSGLLEEVEKRAREEGGDFQALISRPFWTIVTAFQPGWILTPWSWDGVCTAVTVHCRGWC